MWARKRAWPTSPCYVSCPSRSMKPPWFLPGKPSVYLSFRFHTSIINRKKNTDSYLFMSIWEQREFFMVDTNVDIEANCHCAKRTHTQDDDDGSSLKRVGLELLARRSAVLFFRAVMWPSWLGWCLEALENRLARSSTSVTKSESIKEKISVWKHCWLPVPLAREK